MTINSNSIKNKDDIEIIKLCLMSMSRNDFICNRHVLYFILGINTCLKPKELLALEWITLLNDNYTIKNFINYNGYKFYLNTSCKQAILSFINKFDNHTKYKYVFGDNKPITIQAINILYGKIEKELALDYNFSALSLHKTFVYWQIANAHFDYNKMSKLKNLLYINEKNKSINIYSEYNINDDIIYINDVNL